MRKFLLAVLLLTASRSIAQTLTTVNENLATSTNTLLVDTVNNRLDVGTAAYTGNLPGVALFVASNAVVGTGTGANGEIVLYATGTIQISQNGAPQSTLPNSPLIMNGNTNGALQYGLQNLSGGANATGSSILTGNLGGNASFYLEAFVNSSKYANSNYSAQASSSTGIESSDADLHLWADINGGLNGGSGSVIFGSSNPLTANIAAVIMPATAAGPGALVVKSSITFSSNTFMSGNLTVSTFTGITAGTSITTMTPCGELFYYSSGTVVGSTDTSGTALTILSTFTYQVNTLTSRGDALNVICVFEDGSVAPGTSVEGVYIDGTVVATAADVTASDNVVIESIGRLMTAAAPHAMLWTSSAFHQTAALTAAVSVAASGVGIGQFGFDPTASHTINCKASRATGGAINFVYMSVAKACK